MDAIEKFLNDRKCNGLLRKLQGADVRKNGKIHLGGRELFDFSSNDYLGLSDHVALKDAAVKTTEKYGTSSSASRLLSGDLKIHHELEEKTALFKGKESALVFNSGYQANVGIISALCKKGDVVICDKLSHASILDGISLSGANVLRFQHNDISHLESLLKKSAGKFKNCLIVTESVFSMDGDKAPLKEIVDLKEKYGCKMVVDEAHATGIFGKNGSGVVDDEGLNGEVDLIMGTFSKALGSFGAYVACSQKMKEYLINACRSFIYSTALPPAVIAADIEALRIVAAESFRRENLLENASYFRRELEKMDLETRGQSQIVPLIIGGAEETLAISNALIEKGYFVCAIRPPTVPPGGSRLRFSLTYHHSKETLRGLIEEIGKTIYV